MLKKIFLAPNVLLQACAFTDAELAVSHDDEVNIVGPISDIEKLRF